MKCSITIIIALAVSLLFFTNIYVFSLLDSQISKVVETRVAGWVPMRTKDTIFDCFPARRIVKQVKEKK